MRSMLVLACVVFLGNLPVCAFGANADAGSTQEAGNLLGAYRALVEEHIAGVRSTLRAIAGSSDAVSGDFNRVEPLLARFAADLETDAAVWFALPDGSYSTAGPRGATGLNLADRHYFPALMAGNEVFGDLVVSRSSGHRSVIVAVPVLADDKTVGAVGVSLRVRALSRLVDRALHLQEDRYFYALDRDTRIVLHRMAERMFRTPADVGDEALGQEFRRALEAGPRGTFDYTLDGRRIRSVYEFSPALGWYFFLAEPE